jgi:nitrogen regulatory protein PII
VNLKRIEAVFSPVHLAGVLERLRMIGVHGMTLHELRTQTAHVRHITYRGVAMQSDLEEAVRIDVVTEADQVASLVGAIQLVVRRTQPPEGYIYITPVDEVIRIRTGETGRDAL